MSKNKKTQQKTKKPEEKELYGNVIVVTVGCKECPVNNEFRIFNREDSDKTVKAIGKVIECSNCHGKWMLKRIQMRGVIIDDEQTQEWRVSPLFVPILSSFDINKMNILDVPVSLIEDEKED